MEKFIKNITAVLILVFALILISTYFKQKTKTNDLYYRQQFNSLKTEILRIKAEIKAVKADTDTLKADTDTLKVGQRIIFDEVKKNAEKSFWDFFEP